MTAITGNMLIAQSGGPTMVINQSLAGAVIEARKHTCIQTVFGALHGIQGILDENFINLSRESRKTLEAIAVTPSSALGSVRKKPSGDECQAIFKVLKKHHIRFFFYIGGNDSAETVHIINEAAKQTRHPLRCFHIPKTIDNDLRANDHTPGFGSAARFVACAFMGDDLDNRAMGGVKINIVMGRHAGFLTAASALGRTRPDDGPHLIYLPERPFSLERFAAEITSIYQKLGRCVIAVSEGISDEKGVTLASRFCSEVDAHGNVQLSGNGALGDFLASEVKARTPIRRVRADTFGYLQRSFPGIASETDAQEARAVGVEAVKIAVEGKYKDGSIAIRRRPGRAYAVDFKRMPLKSVARETRTMPPAFICKTGSDVTQAFLDYAAPIIGALPASSCFTATAPAR